MALFPLSPTDVLLEDWARENGITLDESLHVTLLYSRRPLQVFPTVSEHVGIPDRFEVFGKKLVLVLDAPSIEKRHDFFIAAGGTHDHPSFVPHVTLCDAANIDMDDLELPNFTLIFGKEYTEVFDG